MFIYLCGGVGVLSEVRALFPLVKDDLRATLLGGILAGFSAYNTAVTAYNTAITNLLLLELIRRLPKGERQNPNSIEELPKLLIGREDVENSLRVQKSLINSISNSLMEIAEEHLTRREIEEVRRYVETLQELIK